MFDSAHEDISWVRVDGRESANAGDVEGMPPPGSHGFEGKREINSVLAGADELYREANGIPRSDLSGERNQK